MVEKFEFDSKLKKNLIIMMVIGVVGLIWAFLAGLHDGHHQSRFWSNILLNVYYFTGIGIFGIFFVSANQLGYSGWITLVKRIYMSLSGFLVVAAVFALIIIGGVWLHYHNLYDHWALPEEMKKLANTKQTFFNPTFWTVRVVLYFVLWVFVGKAVIKAINSKDIADPKVYKRSKLMAALWIVIFAVTESFVSWDLVMSTDPHWYSTLFGWYNFASYGCAAFAMAILLVIFLKSRGHLPQVNENHIHDMGKYMFAWSILWSYMWFDQFMLQWYANLPEDTNYWVKRFDVPLFKFTVALSVAINLGVPLLLFIKRGAKRNLKYAAFIAVVVFLGHYLDFFNQTMFEPNAIAETKECCKKGEGEAECCKKKEAALATGATVFYAENKTEGKTEDKAAVKDEKPATDAAKTETTEPKSAGEAASQSNAEAKETKAEEKAEAKEGGKEEEAEEAPKTRASLGLPELMILTGFLGAFLFMFFREFSKDTTFNENDPYLKESLRHHVEYA
ncbi:MAG: hypothetical protein JWO03_260 [Bacteroidetes bacterium]|nr:hypothetical protein [Bacteroidota bacterium]